MSSTLGGGNAGKNQRNLESSCNNHQKATINHRPSSANADRYEAYRQNSYRYLNSDRTDAPNQNTNNKVQFKNVSIRGQRPSSAPGDRFVNFLLYKLVMKRNMVKK